MKTILIQGAEPHETIYLESKLLNSNVEQFGGFTFTKGNIGNDTIIISRIKIGQINAASATTMGILKYNPDFIINQGTSGSHSKNIHKGDLVVGEKYFQTNSFKTLQNAEESSKIVFREFSSEEVKGQDFSLASEKLVKFAKEILPKVTSKNVYYGTIASGDIWNNNMDKIKFFNDNYKTLCEEMETAGVYKISNQFGIPAISIKIVSNNELLGEKYSSEIAKECQEVIYKFILKLGDEK